ncbi:helix-turn-helix domain-containing protein [Flavobacterium sp. 3-210]
MINNTNLNEFLTIAEIDSNSKSAIFDIDPAELTMIWNRGGTMQVNIDKACYEISKNAIFFLNSFHRIEGIDLISARMLRFSKALCSSGQDNNIDLRSLCDFSGGQLKIIAIDEEQLDHLESAWSFFYNEMNSADTLQKDMLSLLLKRILRFCCKTQQCEKQKKYLPDLVSSFNFLVEDHFFEHHDVAFYASKLNKSPKTLSILFSLVMGCPPKDFIHDRIMADARNQIRHTDKSIKEIAYDLGYEDIQTFSRFFKNKEGISPLHYREKIKELTVMPDNQQFSA